MLEDADLRILSLALQQTARAAAKENVRGNLPSSRMRTILERVSSLWGNTEEFRQLCCCLSCACNPGCRSWRAIATQFILCP